MYIEPHIFTETKTTQRTMAHRTTSNQQQVFVAQNDTYEAAELSVQRYLSGCKLNFPIIHRECGPTSDEQLGRSIALNEPTFGAFIYTSNDNETYSATSRKRGYCVKFFSVIYSLSPA